MLFLSAEDSIDKHLTRMKQDKTWGDGNVIAAAATLYRRPMRIFSVGHNDQPMIIDGGPLQQQHPAVPLTLGFVAEI